MAKAPASRKKVFLIDGSGYVFRAFFAIPALSTSKGFPTNAIFGFANMLIKTIRDHAPDYVVMAFDAKGKTFRDDLFTDYKANRPETPDRLIPQLPYIRDLVRAFRIGQVELEGYEADDVIGTLAERLRKRGVETVIVSGDKDLLQLVGGRISMLDTMKGLTYGSDEVVERFGVPAEKVVEVLGLAGDTSDNIPGVPGIGEKTAASLIREFGSIEAVLERVGEVKGEKRRENLLAHRDQALLSRNLATIKRDVPIDFELERFTLREPDRTALGKLFADLEFERLSREFGAGEAGIPDEGYRTILDPAALREFLEAAAESGELAVDVETSSPQPMRAALVGVSLAGKPGDAAYVPLAHVGHGVPEQIPIETCVEILGPYLANAEIRKVGQNLKFDWIVLRRHGVELAGVGGDAMIASYLLDPSRFQHNLDALARDHLGHKTITYEEVAGKGKKKIPFSEVPLDRAAAYACEDADVALRLVHKLEPRLGKDDLAELYSRIEIPLLVVLARMEMNGVLIDTDLLAALSEKFEAELGVIEGRAHELAGVAFNLNSPKQLAGVLYEKLKLPVLKRTRKGAVSTDIDVLERLAAEHDLPREIVRHRQLAKLKGTYIDALPSLINPETGRIHTSYNQTVAATGRLSSSDPNLQNIPIRSPEGREIRRAFVPGPGRRLLSADYSQIELCILAHLSEDPTLVAAFRENEDIHRRTASEVFGVSPEKVTEAQRSGAKAVNFGLMYGLGAFGLAQQLGISTREAEAYISGYFRRFAAVRAYFDRTLGEAREKGYVTTLMKRRRYLPDIESKNRVARSAAERMAVNTTIQGTAADLIKAAMLAVQGRLDREFLDTLMIMQVHDELVFEVPEADLPKVKTLVRKEMEQIASLRVPLRVEVRDGANWDEAH
jgi:DNA polymerase-1